ncbi:MAG: MaoC family dehydratase [Pusillimonas sp.]
MNLQVGQQIFSKEIAGSSKEAVAMFSIATEDPNPIHVDEAFANKAGFPQVIQQGPMTTAFFANLLAQELGADRLKMLDVSFTAPVFPGEALTLTSEVTAIDDVVHLALSARKADGTQTAKGVATIELQGRSPE